MSRETDKIPLYRHGYIQGEETHRLTTRMSTSDDSNCIIVHNLCRILVLKKVTSGVIENATFEVFVVVLLYV